MLKIHLKRDYLSLSHALRIPLAEILGMADLLDNEKLSPSQQEEVEIIRQAGSRLLSVVDEILTSGRGKHKFFC